MQNYERLGVLELSQVLPFIPTVAKQRAIRTFFNQRVSLATKRLRIFAVKGTKCIICGLQGSFFAIERHKKTGCTDSSKEAKFRPNLYAIENSTKKEVMITIDHVKPKAKGGKNNFHNLQPMCEHCNFSKGDIVLCPTQAK